MLILLIPFILSRVTNGKRSTEIKKSANPSKTADANKSQIEEKKVTAGIPTDNKINLVGIEVTEGEPIAMIEAHSKSSIGVFQIRKSDTPEDYNSWTVLKNYNAYSDSSVKKSSTDNSYKISLAGIDDKSTNFSITAKFEDGSTASTQAFHRTKDGKFTMNKTEKDKSDKKSDKNKKDEDSEESSFPWMYLLIGGIVVVVLIGGFIIFTKCT